MASPVSDHTLRQSTRLPARSWVMRSRRAPGPQMSASTREFFSRTSCMRPSDSPVSSSLVLLLIWIYAAP